MSKKKNKVTWAAVYADFEKRQPKLSKHAIHYNPYAYATILIFLDDGMRVTYNYDTKSTRVISNAKD